MDKTEVTSLMYVSRWFILLCGLAVAGLKRNTDLWQLTLHITGRLHLLPRRGTKNV